MLFGKSNVSSFKTKYSFEERYKESSRVLGKYTDRLPVICEKNAKNTDIEDITKNKYLVPYDLTCGQFMYIIRQRLKLPAEKGIFLLINGMTPSSTDTIFNMYYKYKDPDNFLYITYASENIFG